MAAIQNTRAQVSLARHSPWSLRCVFLSAPGRPCFPVGPLERACIPVTWEPVVVCTFLGPHQTGTVKQLWGWAWESAF